MYEMMRMFYLYFFKFNLKKVGNVKRNYNMWWRRKLENYFLWLNMQFQKFLPHWCGVWIWKEKKLFSISCSRSLHFLSLHLLFPKNGLSSMVCVIDCIWCHSASLILRQVVVSYMIWRDTGICSGTRCKLNKFVISVNII